MSIISKAEISILALQKEARAKKNEIGLSEYGLLSLWFLSVATAQIGTFAGEELRRRTELCNTDSGVEAQLSEGADESPIVLDNSTTAAAPLLGIWV